MNEFQKTPPSETSNPSASDKAPFVVTDLVLILTAIGILTFTQHPLSGSAVWTITLLVFSGAWIAVTPWIMEQRSKTKLAELEGLKGVEESIQKMNSFSDGVNSALLSLSNVQEIAQASAKRAAEAEEKIAQYGLDFEERFSKAANYEKSALQLEIDKLKRIEKDWVSSASGMLDHILALASAGIHSGKPEIAEQMKRFRAACLDIASHAGIQPYMPAPTDLYDPEKHAVPPNAPTPAAEAKIARVLAPGFIYQGVLIRKAMILTEDMEFTQEAGAPAKGVTHSFASTPAEAPQAEAESSFTPAEPLEEEAENESPEQIEPEVPEAAEETEEIQEVNEVEETEEAEEIIPDLEEELEEEEEKTAELSEDLLGEVEENPVEENTPTDREDEPLHESELLFRQESFESLSPEELSPDEEAEEAPEASEIEAPEAEENEEEEEDQFPNEKKRDNDDKLPL
ncbi:MAG: nucleotide exchange factor GrpE [Verrucomicrobiae bacterium]|nr:nucleotide exchange factor GrpE [Verrucomicrobiae bacterium]